ncbi:MAG: rRNA maturation RNase YbeY [Acidobacteriota bacterium]|nr:rRNA maturation RNase YbeY [Acidobacteriota bacterium]
MTSKKMENRLIEVVNRQRKIKIDLEIWYEFAGQAARAVNEAAGKSLTVAFVSDGKMRELNALFRGKRATTDVLSFPSEPDEFEGIENFLGDIVISLEQAEKQAEENDLEFETEIKQLILHGILHLCGYDHETDAGEMNEREFKLRDKLKIT